jgi:hypothetical protein
MKHLVGDFVFPISLKPILTARAFLSNTFFLIASLLIFYQQEKTLLSNFNSKAL